MSLRHGHIRLESLSLEGHRLEGTLDILVVLRCYPLQEIYQVAQKKSELFSKGDPSSKDFVNEMYDFARVFDPSLDKQKIFKVFSVLEKFDERKWQDKLCGQAIDMLREIQDFIASLDGEKYDHRTEDQKRYRLPDQWPHNLHLVKKENEEFYK